MYFVKKSKENQGKIIQNGKCPPGAEKFHKVAESRPVQIPPKPLLFTSSFTGWGFAPWESPTA